MSHLEKKLSQSDVGSFVGRDDGTSLSSYTAVFEQGAVLRGCYELKSERLIPRPAGLPSHTVFLFNRVKALIGSV